jgi:hypothetical protein
VGHASLAAGAFDFDFDFYGASLTN